MLHYGGVRGSTSTRGGSTFGGLLDEPKSFSWDEFMALGPETAFNDIHCVTTWSSTTTVGGCHDPGAVQAGELKPEAGRCSTATAATPRTCPSPTSRDDVMFARSHDGEPLSKDMAGRCGWWCPSSTSGRARSGSAASSSWTGPPGLLGDVRLP